MMTWEILPSVLSTGIAVVSVFITQFNRSMMQSVKLEIAQLRLEMAETRSKDRDDLRSWINGSFLRAREVEAKFEGLDRRIDEVERRSE